MTKTRLEAFSDGVFAIIITIMVLELKIPHDSSLEALTKLWPVFLSYVMSFIFIGIYWGNHHHLLSTVHHVTGGMIWANNSLLFSLSLIPFTTGWMGENHFDKLPVAVYAFNLLFAGVMYYILQKVIVRHYTHSTKMIEALKKSGYKGNLSVILYASSIPIAFFAPYVSAIIFVLVAIAWIIPDRNLEEAMKGGREGRD